MFKDEILEEATEDVYRSALRGRANMIQTFNILAYLQCVETKKAQILREKTELWLKENKFSKQILFTNLILDNNLYLTMPEITTQFDISKPAAKKLLEETDKYHFTGGGGITIYHIDPFIYEQLAHQGKAEIKKWHLHKPTKKKEKMLEDLFEVRLNVNESFKFFVNTFLEEDDLINEARECARQWCFENTEGSRERVELALNNIICLTMQQTLDHFGVTEYSARKLLSGAKKTRPNEDGRIILYHIDPDTFLKLEKTGEHTVPRVYKKKRHLELVPTHADAPSIQRKGERATEKKRVPYLTPVPAV